MKRPSIALHIAAALSALTAAAPSQAQRSSATASAAQSISIQPCNPNLRRDYVRYQAGNTIIEGNNIVAAVYNTDKGHQYGPSNPILISCLVARTNDGREARQAVVHINGQSHSVLSQQGQLGLQEARRMGALYQAQVGRGARIRSWTVDQSSDFGQEALSAGARGVGLQGIAEGIGRLYERGTSLGREQRDFVAQYGYDLLRWSIADAVTAGTIMRNSANLQRMEREGATRRHDQVCNSPAYRALIARGGQWAAAARAASPQCGR